jgi:hypothetical protein
VPFGKKAPKLEAWEKEQIAGVVGEPDEESEMREMQIADVVDTRTGAVLYQLMLWPYGDGAIVENRTTNTIAGICQHGLDSREPLGKAWVRDLARAWVEGAKRLKLSPGHIDFSAEELGPPPDEDDGEG